VARMYSGGWRDWPAMGGCADGWRQNIEKKAKREREREREGAGMTGGDELGGGRLVSGCVGGRR
jgi:hypothetical protein